MHSLSGFEAFRNVLHSFRMGTCRNPGRDSFAQLRVGLVLGILMARASAAAAEYAT